MERRCRNLPISSFYEVVDYETISKSSNWWSAIVLVKAGRKMKIGLYLWHKKDEKWKRKNKFTISNIEQYKDIKKVLDKYTEFL